MKNDLFLLIARTRAALFWNSAGHISLTGHTPCSGVAVDITLFSNEAPVDWNLELQPGSCS